MSRAYTFTIPCDTCDARMETSVLDLTADPDRDPVIDVDSMLSQVTFECRECGGVTYTGDFMDNTEHEAGENR